MQIDIINGPNLNLIGQREPSIYGNLDFDVCFKSWKQEFNIDLRYFQSNIEGEIIGFLQNSEASGIVLNAGAYTHTSIAIRDAISAISKPVIEVHLSNVSGRESFRHESFITPVCIGCIFGFGMDSYRMAIRQFIEEAKR